MNSQSENIIKESNAFDIKDFIELIKNHWLIILTFVLTTSLFSFYLAIKAKPVYQASTSLMIERPSRMGSLDQLFGMMGMNWEFYPNQIHVLKSTPVAKKVVQRIGIEKFIPKQAELKWYEKLLPGSVEENYADKSSDELFNLAIKNVQSTMAVSQSKGSGVFYIAFDDYDPYLATLKANALAESYIEEVIEVDINAKQRTGENISKQLPELKKKVQESEQKLKQYQRKHQMFMPEGGDDLAVQELTQLSSRIGELKRKKLSLESVYRRIKSIGNNSKQLARIPALLDKSEVVRLKNELTDVESEVSSLALVYGPKHPKMKKAVELRRLTQLEYDGVLRVAADLVVADYESITQEIIHEESGVKSIKGEISSNNEQAFEYNSLKRDYNYNKQIYDAFLKQSKETDAVKTSSVQTINARVINKATVPSSPYKPNKKIMIVIGIFVGLLLGIAVSFLMEHFDNTFKSSREVESKINLPVIGMLPDIDEKDSGSSPAMQFVENTKSAFSESIRTLRTGVLLSLPDVENKSILVTSTVPSEGKTTVAMNLAHSLSHLGETILVEADLRRPMVKKNMGMTKQAGLTTLLSGEASFAECITVEKGSGKLHTLASGMIPPNPLELLSSEKFDVLLSKLKSKYKFVVVDCAPVMAVSDALVLSQKVDGVLFVLKNDSTPSQLVEGAITRLRRSSAKIIGVAMNRLRTSKAKYGRYYKYEGSYYGHYGYHEEEKKSSKQA